MKRQRTAPQNPTTGKMARKGTRNNIDHELVPHLHIFNLNIAQGAGILFVVCLNDVIDYAFLVDGGHACYSTQVSSILANETPDAICITHEDDDHANSPLTFTQIDEEKRYIPQRPLSKQKEAKKVWGTLPVKDSELTLWKSDNDDFPVLTLKWLNVWDQRSKLVDGVNGMSLAGLVSWNGFTYYFDGDLDWQSQAGMITGSPLNTDCHYVTHHGSNESSHKAFLAWLKPAVSIISSGSNPHQHPTEGLLARLVETKGLQKVYFTNCDFNRPQVNPIFWKREWSNFQAMHDTVDLVGKTDADKQKYLAELIDAIKKSLESSEPDITMDDDKNSALLRVSKIEQEYATTLGAIAKPWHKVQHLKDFDCFPAHVMSHLRSYFNALDDHDTTLTQVSGSNDLKSAIVISLSGLGPTQYQVAYVDDRGEWVADHYDVKMPVKDDPHPDFPAPDNALYKLSETVNKCRSFRKSTRSARDYDETVPRYQCVHCKKLEQKLQKMVSFTCAQCNLGPRRYHIACLQRLSERAKVAIPQSTLDAKITPHSLLTAPTAPLHLEMTEITCPVFHVVRQLRVRAATTK